MVWCTDTKVRPSAAVLSCPSCPFLLGPLVSEFQFLERNNLGVDQFLLGERQDGEEVGLRSTVNIEDQDGALQPVLICVETPGWISAASAFMRRTAASFSESNWPDLAFSAVEPGR